MGSLRRQTEVSAMSCLIYSLVAHGSFAVALMVAKAPMAPQPMAAGTIEITALEGGALPVPQGAQIVEPDPQPIVEPPKPKLKKAKVAKKPAKKPVKKPAKKLAKKPTPVKVKKAKVAKVLPKKEPVEIPKAEVVAEESEVIKAVEVIKEKEQPAVAAMPEPEEKNFEPLDEEPQATALVEELAEEEGSFEPLTNDDIEGEEVDDPQPVAPVVKAKETPVAKKAVQKPAKSNQKFGVPGGVRDVKDVKQVAGNIPPKYPQAARLRKQEGSTRLMYFVTKDGRVSNLKVIQSSGHRHFDQEAVTAVSKWRFVPGQSGYTTHDVRFRLRGNAKEMPSRLRRKTSQMRNNSAGGLRTRTN